MPPGNESVRRAKLMDKSSHCSDEMTFPNPHARSRIGLFVSFVHLIWLFVCCNSFSAEDWRADLKKSLRGLDSRAVQAMQINVRLRSDPSLYSNIKRRCEGRVAAVDNRLDGTATVIFDHLAEAKYSFYGASKIPSIGITPKGERSASITATLIWRDLSRPVPLSKGMSLLLGLDDENVVRAFSYTASKLVAVRQRPDSQWEELIQVSKDNHSRQPLIKIFASHTDLHAGESLPIMIECNETLGLCKGYWSDCGGDESEHEGPSARRDGWEPANSIGTRIQPGRDGWTLFSDLPPVTNDGRRYNIVPPKQYLWDSC